MFLHAIFQRVLASTFTLSDTSILSLSIPCLNKRIKSLIPLLRKNQLSSILFSFSLFSFSLSMFWRFGKKKKEKKNISKIKSKIGRKCMLSDPSSILRTTAWTVIPIYRISFHFLFLQYYTCSTLSRVSFSCLGIDHCFANRMMKFGHSIGK